MVKRDDRFYPRFVLPRVQPSAARHNRWCSSMGPRQCGKTTLVDQLVGGHRSYLTLDDDTVLRIGNAPTPAGFSSSARLDRASIDEVQRGPPNCCERSSAPSIQDRRPGRFLVDWFRRSARVALARPRALRVAWR